VYIGSVILLFITILIFLDFFFKTKVYVFFVEILNTYLEVTLSSLCTAICSAFYKYATLTWSPENESVVMFLFLDFFILSPHLSIRNNLNFVCVCVRVRVRAKSNGDREYPGVTPVSLFIRCRNVSSRFTFIS